MYDNGKIESERSLIATDKTLASDQIIGRRRFLKMTGVGALAFTTGNVTVLLTPSEAHAQKVPLQVLTPDEAKTLGFLGDLIVPGAAQGGIVHFVDQQLSIRPEDCMLMIKMFDVPHPYTDFYKGGLAALNGFSKSQTGKRFADLTPEQAMPVLGAMAQGKTEGWQGPPSEFVYIAVRGDALDVTYGTPKGFEKLGLPYMEHIMPPIQEWSE